MESRQGWFSGNGYIKRASILLGLALTAVLLLQAVGGPLAGMMGLATRDYHRSDMDRVEGLLACMYYEVEPPECPYAPPRPPDVRSPDR